MKKVLTAILALVFTIVLVNYPTTAEASNLSQDQKGLQEAIHAKNWINAAIYSANIAKHYDSIKAYDSAVIFYEDAAKYWGMTANPDWGIQYMNRADEIRSEVELFVEKNIELGHPLGKFEPTSGLYLGMYTAGIKERPSYGEMDFKKIEEVYGKNHAMYLTYVNWTNGQIQFPKAYAESVKEVGSALQIHIQPMSGLDDVKDTEAIRQFARDAKEAGIPIFIRFAGEMNGEWVHWYDPTGKKYIEKFRLVHDIFEQEAPEVAMVWAPNFYPYWNTETFYPGDHYVDWVGVSLYMRPISSGQDTTLDTPFKYIDTLANLYPSKPIMYAEGAVSHFSYENNRDYTNWAVNQLYYKYYYLPRMYPKLKAITYFNLDRKDSPIDTDLLLENFDIGKNTTVYNTYKKLISNEFNISNLTLDSQMNTQTKEYAKISTLREGAGSHKAFVYVKLPEGAQPHYVAAYQGDVKVAESYAIPWEMNIDLSKLDVTKPLVVKVYRADWTVATQKEFKLNYKKVSKLSYFKDINEKHWAFNDINRAVQLGYINGYAGAFNPEAKILIRDFATILGRVYGQQDEMNKLAYPTGVINFMKKMNFPHATIADQAITRTQAAEIIAASQGYNLTGDDAIKYLLVNDLSKGRDANKISVENYEGAASLSRAEAVKFIENVKANGNAEISANPTSKSDVAEIRAQYTERFE